MKRMAIALIVMLAAAAPGIAESGRDIIRSTGIKGALIVHVGYGEGRLTRELLAGDSFVVHGLDTDAGKVSATREYIRSEGVYGKVSVQRLTGTNLPFADNLVNLVVSVDLSGISTDDDTWFNRTTRSVGNANHTQLLVFDESTACGIEAFQSTARKGPFTAGAKGYHLFATALKRSKPDRSSGRKKKGAPARNFSWSTYIPVRGNAMALAGDMLFVAGTPDTIDQADPLAAFEGRKGGVLCAISSADGTELSQYELKSPPVLDGVAAANGRLYVSQTDGSVICFDGR